MPILPRFDGVSTGIHTPNTPGAPSDPRPGQIQALGQAGERLVGTFSQAHARKKSLEDEALVMQRYMTAVTEMEGIHETLQVPENALKAKEVFDGAYSKLEPKWFEGLSSEASSNLKKKLFARSLEYRVGAAKLENRAKIDQYAATLVQAETVYADKASRQTGPDDGSKSPEYQLLADGIDAGVAAGLVKPDKAEKSKKAALQHGAYNRAYKVTTSDNVAEVEYLLDLFKQEDAEPGSTFLKHIDPKGRIDLLNTTKGRQNTLRAEEVRRAKAVREEAEAEHKRVSEMTYSHAIQKLAEPEKYGALTRDWLDLANELTLIGGREHEHLLKVLDGQKSPGDPATIRRLRIAANDTTTPEQAARVHAEVKAAIHADKLPDDIGIPLLNALDEKRRPPKVGGEERQLTMRNLDARAKEQIEDYMRVSGPFDFDGRSNAAKADFKKLVDDNARNGWPKNPLDIVDQNVNRFQTQIGVPATQRANEGRRQIGMPPAAAKSPDNIDTRAAKIIEQLQQLPPGPSSQRTKLLEQLDHLKKLEKLEGEIAHRRDMLRQAQGGGSQSSSGSSSGSQSSSQSQYGASTPAVPGPRRPQ